MNLSALAGNRLLGLFCFLVMFTGWTWGLFYSPTDIHMGEIYRIIYVHVPAAMTAFLSSLILFLASIISLRGNGEKALRWGKATAEVGLIFTVLTLATGSIWGYPTWGTWWTWDARLTTTLILALLYCGYLLLLSSMHPGPQRARVAAVCGILIFVDVPIIYKSVTWWRTLHQPPSLLRSGGSTMSPEMLTPLVIAIVGCMLVSLWLILSRTDALRLKDEADALSMRMMR